MRIFNARHAAAAIVIVGLLTGSAALAQQRGEGEDDATYVHHALICMGTYEYIGDNGPWSHIAAVLDAQKAAEGVYRDVGGKSEDEIKADTEKAEGAIKTIVAEDASQLATYYEPCDNEFLSDALWWRG